MQAINLLLPLLLPASPSEQRGPRPLRHSARLLRTHGFRDGSGQQRTSVSLGQTQRAASTTITTFIYNIIIINIIIIIMRMSLWSPPSLSLCLSPPLCLPLSLPLSVCPPSRLFGGRFEMTR